jgi:cyclopropane fatty-acyl-phospholipid synthase-like methyltransferase
MERTNAAALAARDPLGATEQREVRGATHAWALIFWLLEQRFPTLLGLDAGLALFLTLLSGGGLWTFALCLLLLPPFALAIASLALVAHSRLRDDGPARWQDAVAFRDARDAERYAGRKIPMEVVYESYVSEHLDFKRDVYEVMRERHRFFRFCFTRGDLRFYARKFVGQLLAHDLASDRDDIVPVYDRGNDFYHWFLGESMVYTSGIFRSADETLEAAQQRKLDTVCRYVQMQPGDRHLDIGCGWGTLLQYAAKQHGTHSTGITLAKEQADWARARAAAAGLEDRVEVIVDDYRKLPPRRYDKITCLEMAEHVGVRKFQQFLLQVRSMLEDDGIFYLQIAGFRRAWQYEDLVWGLFMGKYIFPGADASCPLGFVVSQAERAGFEVHRVENCGVHYALTIEKWYRNWQDNREAIVAAYGERWFRLWSMFLAWSALIAAQGSSTVFMITLAKNIARDKDSVSPAEGETVAYSRKRRWIGPNPIATQQ